MTIEQPIIFIAFGVTGDLMRQKILPALFALHENKKLPTNFTLIGISRKNWTQQDFQTYIQETGGSASFAANCQFLQGDIADAALYTQLHTLLDTHEAQKIFYISLSPALYQTLFTHLASFGDGTTALMIEKPFGLDQTSATALATQLHENFPEAQLYRIDHYLAKDSVRSLAGKGRDAIRIEIRLLETGGIGERGASYDSVGALRDVGQNHLLEVLAIALGGNTPEGRQRILERLPILSATQVAEATRHEQYAGYRETPGVAQHSQTETYFQIMAEIPNDEGRPVEILLEAGKHMRQSIKEVRIYMNDGREEHFSLESRKSSEYQTLLQGCFEHKRDLFVSEDEVAALWRFIDPIHRHWYT